MRKKINYSFMIIITFFCFMITSNASTYTPNTNLFEGSYTNNLIDMANSQVDNFLSKDYVIFLIDNTYYLASGKVDTFNDFSITLKDVTIVQAYRPSSGYYNYEYSTFLEDTTTINTSYIVISNIKTKKSVTSTRFNDYKYRYDLTNLGIFILGLLFAMFLLKGRSF